VKRALRVLALLLPLSPSALAGSFDVSAHVGYYDLTAAKESAKAVFGSSGGGIFGAGGRYRFDNGLFVAAGASFFKKTGERVFVAEPGAEVFPLGHPLELKLIPIEATIGWRFGGGGLLTPYIGVGGGLVSYSEESTVAGITEKESSTKGSSHVLAGVELGRGSLRFGIEAGYSIVPSTIGLGGVSKIYGEDDVGGFRVLGKIIFGKFD
jgi:hypothetical protein